MRISKNNKINAREIIKLVVEFVWIIFGLITAPVIRFSLMMLFTPRAIIVSEVMNVAIEIPNKIPIIIF